MHRVAEHFGENAIQKDMTDGISFEYSNWRFNLRASNTEPYVRLNVETKGNKSLLNEKVLELTKVINNKNC